MFVATLERLVGPFPDVVRIESAGRCNFKCTHCPVGMFGNTRGLLSFADFVMIFESLPLIPRVLVLYHGGEPLLNKELELMIAHAKARKVDTVLFNSNASLLTVERGKALALAGLDELRVSFDGSTPEENNQIRVGSNFEKHAAIVKQVAALLPVTIYNVKFNDNPTPGHFLRDYFGAAVKYRTDPARIWAHNDTTSKPSTGVDYCGEMSEKFSILADGDVVTCCEDLLGDYRFGNVFYESPLTIWERMQPIRDTFARKDYPELCKHCYVVTGARLELDK